MSVINATIATAQVLQDPYKLVDCVYKEDLVATCKKLGIDTTATNGNTWDEQFLAEKLTEMLPTTWATTK